MGILRLLTATMAQPGHLEYQRCLAASTPSAGGGGTGLSRFEHRTAQIECRYPEALIATTMSKMAASCGGWLAQTLESRKEALRVGERQCVRLVRFLNHFFVRSEA
jgi:hypothetical protein